MSQLATIAPILNAVSQGMGVITGAVKGDPFKSLSSLAGMGSSLIGNKANTPGLGDYNLGNYGNKLSLADTLSTGSTGLGSLSSSSAGLGSPTQNSSTNPNSFDFNLNNPYSRNRRG